MSDIVPAPDDELDSDLAREFSAAAGVDINVGDYFIDSYGGVKVVLGFKRESDRQGKSVALLYEGGWGKGDANPSSFKISDEGHSEYIILHETYEELKEQAKQNFLNPPPPPSANTQTTALVGHVPRGVAREARNRLVAVVQKREVLHRIAKTMLDQMTRGMSAMQEQLSYMSRVVRMLEAYLGVYEQIVLIQDGVPASADEPITIRQLVVYMDEEVGDVEVVDGVEGIDFQRVEDFDAWLLKNISRFAPEQKCIVAAKPSRQHRHYTDDIWDNVWFNQQNAMTYLIIRNGEKVYRLWTNLKLPDRLFPSSEEYAKILDGLEKGDSYDARRAKLLDLDWKEIVVLLQGVIERTDCLHPYPSPNIHLFNPVTYESGWVRLVYDAALSFGDGRVPFERWKRAINAPMKKGDRLFLLGRWDYSDYDWLKRRFTIYLSSVPGLPDTGIYTIEEVKVEKERRLRAEAPDRQFHERIKGGHPEDYEEVEKYSYRILFMPEREVYTEWGYGSKERERRMSFWLYPEDKLIAYDTPSLDDINYYIGSRVERHNYLDVLPILYRLRIDRQKELKIERGLAEAMALRLNVPTSQVMEVIQWWKFKVKSHRAVMSDDAKAWRMIEKEITKRRNRESSTG